MVSTGLLPLADINYIINYVKNPKEGTVKGLLKAIAGVYNFLVDFVPDGSVADVPKFSALSAPLSDAEFVEKLEDLKGYSAQSEGLPVWVVPVLLKLLELASLFLKG